MWALAGGIKYQSTWTTVTTPKCFVFSSATVLSRNSKPPQMLTHFAQNEQIWLTQRPPLIEAGKPSLPLPVRDDMTTCKYLKRHPNKGGGHFLLLLPILDLVQKYPLTWTPKKTNYNKLKCWAQSLRRGVMAVAQWRSESARRTLHEVTWLFIISSSGRQHGATARRNLRKGAGGCLCFLTWFMSYILSLSRKCHRTFLQPTTCLNRRVRKYPHYSYNVCFHPSSNGINEKLQI